METFFTLRIDYISILISLIILQIFAKNSEHPWNEVSKIAYTTCKKYQCLERARYLDESLDTSINPCDDFYQYACGGWIEKHPVPTTEMEYSIETYLKLIVMKRLKYLLEHVDHQKEKAEVKVAKKLYHECMKRRELGRINANVVKSHLMKQGSWLVCSSPEHLMRLCTSWVKLLKYNLQISNDMPLFNIYVGLNKDKEPIIQLEEVSEPFVMLDVVQWNKEKEQLYIKFLTQMMKSLKRFDRKNCDIDKYIPEIIHFRKKLNEIIEFLSETTANSEKSVNEMTIDQFQLWYNSKTVVLKSKTKVKIPWLDIIQAAYPVINDVEVNKDTKIIVKNKEYFELLAKLLDETPIKVIVNHIQMYFVEAHLKMDSKLFKLLREVILHDNTFLDDILQDTDKLHFCILEHPMKETLANMYNEAYLSRDTEENVYAMVEEIKETLKRQMTESKWLHEAVKFEIGQKLSRTYTIIGMKDASERNVQRPLLKKKGSVTKMVPSILPEAAYVLRTEHILIGTGYLQSPIYDDEMPFTINYGSLGPFLGHELFHSFQSALSGKYKKIVQKGDNSTSVLYTEKTKCFIEHYKHLDITELNDLPANCYVSPNLIRTVDENIADTMGLKAAYEAYRKKLWQNKNVCSRLPNNIPLSCDQQFFISFALTFCGNIPSMELRKILKHMEHLPPRMRVNGAVSNLQAFNNAFKCSNKAQLNSMKKCNVWE